MNQQENGRVFVGTLCAYLAALPLEKIGDPNKTRPTLSEMNDCGVIVSRTAQIY